MPATILGREFSDRELEIFVLAMSRCIKGDDEFPAIDYKKLAEVAGLKTAASANTAWCGAKKKFLSGWEEGAVELSKKRKAEGDGEEVPKKKGRAKKGTAKKVVAKEDQEIETEDAKAGNESDGEGVPPKKKSRAKKGTAKKVVAKEDQEVEAEETKAAEDEDA